MPPLPEGKTIAEIGERFEGDILGDNPKTKWGKARKGAEEAVRNPGVEIVHLSYSDTKTDNYIFEVFSDLLIHSWDLARGIGADEKLDPELVRICYQKLSPKASDLRKSGLYGEEVKTGPKSDLQTKLLALLGRRA